jgi:NRDE-2, necessary for RNA interference
MSFPSFSSFPVEQLQDAVQYSSFPAVEDAKDDQAPEQGEIVLSTIHKKKKHKADKKLKSNKDKVGGDGLGAGEYLNFYKDLKPNFNNVKYQTISNTAIPHYKRFGTQVLGYEVQIARGSNDQKRLILEYEAKSEVYKRYAKITPNPIKVKVGSCITNEFDEGHMFIQVNNDEFEIDVQPDTNPDFKENVEFRARTAEIDLQIQHDPSNVTAWLKLVSLQESMLPLSNKQSTKKFIVEKQLAILDKALSHVQTDTLLSAYMNTFQQFENYQNVMRKWSEILNKYPNSYNLWFGYLNFRQTAASQFIVL